MTEIVHLLEQIFQQYGLIGLLVGFLILGPGFTILRTRTIRTQAEAKAQSLVNEFARQERQRADRLEEQLSAAQCKLDSTETEVSRLRLKLVETQGKLDAMPDLRRQLRKLSRRVRELEAAIEQKSRENEVLRRTLDERERESKQNQQRIRELERHLSLPEREEQPHAS